MITAQIAEPYAFAYDRLAIRWAIRDPEAMRPQQVAKVGLSEFNGAVLEYEPYEPDWSNGAKPTLSLTEAEARALLEALAAHFGGTGPARAARDDFLHERGRVDKLTDALIRAVSARTAG